MSLPGGAEPDVGERYGAPDQEGRDATQIDNVGICRCSSCRNVHHRQGATRIGKQDGRDRHPAPVCPTQKLGGHLALGHKQDGPAGNVDARVDGTQACDKDESIDEVHTALPSSILYRHRHWATQGSIFAADESVGVPRTCQAKEYGAAHIHKDDSPKDLSNRQGDRSARVLGLRRGDCDRLHSGIECAAKDKDGCDALEPIRKGTRVMPVARSQSGRTWNAASHIHQRKDKVCHQTDKLEKRKPELGFTEGFNSEQLESSESRLFRSCFCQWPLRTRFSGLEMPDTTYPKYEKISPDRNLRTPQIEYTAYDIILVG